MRDGMSLEIDLHGIPTHSPNCLFVALHPPPDFSQIFIRSPFSAGFISFNGHSLSKRSSLFGIGSAAACFEFLLEIRLVVFPIRYIVMGFTM